MKKIIIFFVLSALLVNVSAQTQAYNDCLTKARFMEGEWRSNPSTPFPKIITAGKSAALNKNNKLKDKLSEIRKILFEAYPKPLATNIMYTLWSKGKWQTNSPIGVLLQTMIAPLVCKDDGGVKKEFGDAMSNVQVSIYINCTPNTIKEVPMLTAVIDTNKIKKLHKVYVSPPRNNFDEEFKWEEKLKKPDTKFGNAADKYITYRNIELQKDDYERHEETVILTANHKIPYAPIKRGEFLTLLELFIQKGIATENTILSKGDPNQNNLALAKANLVEKNKKLEGIAYLRNLYKDDLEKPARVLPEYGYFEKIIGNNLIAEKNGGIIKPIFAEEKQNSCTYYRSASFFKSDKDEDIQLICVNWEYTRYIGNNPEKIKYPHISYGLDNAMQNKFDWDKLAGLLMPIK